MALALADPSFAALLSLFPRPATGRARSSPVPGRQAPSPAVTRQPCEEGGPVPSCELCHEAAWSGPAREWRGPSLGTLLCRVLELAAMLSPCAPAPSQKPLPKGKNQFSLCGKAAAIMLVILHPSLSLGLPSCCLVASA